MPQSSSDRQPSPIAFICLLLLFGYFSINVLQTMTDEYSHQDKLLSLERQVQQLTERKEQLQQELESVKSDQFIEAEARDKLHMGKPNEKVVIFPQSAHVLADTSRPSDTESTRQSWDMGHVDDWLIAIFDK